MIRFISRFLVDVWFVWQSCRVRCWARRRHWLRVNKAKVSRLFVNLTKDREHNGWVTMWQWSKWIRSIWASCKSNCFLDTRWFRYRNRSTTSQTNRLTSQQYNQSPITSCQRLTNIITSLRTADIGDRVGRRRGAAVRASRRLGDGRRCWWWLEGGRGGWWAWWLWFVNANSLFNTASDYVVVVDDAVALHSIVDSVG